MPNDINFIIYFPALIIGVFLGLIGGGGSILTVPTFVYLCGVNPVVATGYSLFVVGISALITSINNLRKKTIDMKMGMIFAIPSFIAVYLTRIFILPAIPQSIFRINNFVLTKDLGILLFFAIIMIVASLFMILGKEIQKERIQKQKKRNSNYFKISIEGFIVGVLTGLVGAGGGFLIIPSLVLLGKLPMKIAVGTSLFIISIKSLFGFLGDIQIGQNIEWGFLLPFTFFVIAGTFLGSYFSRFISNKKLRKGFGWFVITMAIYIIYKELIYS